MYCTYDAHRRGKVGEVFVGAGQEVSVIVIDEATDERFARVLEAALLVAMQMNAGGDRGRRWCTFVNICMYI